LEIAEIMKPKTMFEKIWEAHVVHEEPGQPSLIYIDRHLVHEVTSPQAFEGLRLLDGRCRRPDLTFATMDHNVPTNPDVTFPSKIPSPPNRWRRWRKTARSLGWHFLILAVPIKESCISLTELGLTLPGLTLVCGDSHTSTHEPSALSPLALGLARLNMC